MCFALLNYGLQRARTEEASSLSVSRPGPAHASLELEETLSFTADFPAGGRQLRLELFALEAAEAGALLQALRTLQAKGSADHIEVGLRHAMSAAVTVVSAGLRDGGFQPAAAPDRWHWQASEQPPRQPGAD